MEITGMGALSQAPRHPASASPSEARLLEQYHTALQSYVFEGQAFWNRITAFVLLNSSLLVAYGAIPKGSDGHAVRVGIAVLGLAAAALWGHTALRSRYLIGFWVEVLQDLEQRLDPTYMNGYHARKLFLSGRPVALGNGVQLRLPWLARGNVNDSTSFALTGVFAIVWIALSIKLA